MVGGVFHMVGQLAVVAFTFSPYVALVYLPVLMISGLVTGLLTGYVCRLVIRTTAKSNLFKSRARELARREGAAKAPAAGEAMPAVKCADKPASVCEAEFAAKSTAKPNAVCGAASDTCEAEPAVKSAAAPAPCAAPETDESNDQSETSEFHV